MTLCPSRLTFENNRANRNQKCFIPLGLRLFPFSDVGTGSDLIELIVNDDFDGFNDDLSVVKNKEITFEIFLISYHVIAHAQLVPDISNTSFEIKNAI